MNFLSLERDRNFDFFVLERFYGLTVAKLIENQSNLCAKDIRLFVIFFVIKVLNERRS